jgi:hypothetical protein
LCIKPIELLYSKTYLVQIIDDRIQLMQQWADYLDNESITEKKGCIKKAQQFCWAF